MADAIAERSALARFVRRRGAAAILFLAPMVIVLAAVAAWPLARTIWFGFTDASLDNLPAAKFVGLRNYFHVLTLESGRHYFSGLLVDPVWWRSVWNTVKFAAISVFFETVFGTIVALVLNAEFPGRGIVRAAVLVPWAVPTIVSAKMWAWMLNDQFGILNDLLMRLGVLSHPVAWTASPDTALAAVLIVDIWKSTPFMALLILAGLQAFRTYRLWLESQAAAPSTSMEAGSGAAEPAAPEPAPLERLVVKKLNREFILNASDIDRIDADGNYVAIHAQGQTWPLRESLAWQIERAELSASQRRQVLDRLAACPDGRALCHMDFHPDQVLLDARGDVVVDWLTAARGDPRS